MYHVWPCAQGVAICCSINWGTPRAMAPGPLSSCGKIRSHAACKKACSAGVKKGVVLAGGWGVLVGVGALVCGGVARAGRVPKANAAAPVPKPCTTWRRRAVGPEPCAGAGCCPAKGVPQGPGVAAAQGWPELGGVGALGGRVWLRTVARGCCHRAGSPVRQGQNGSGLTLR